jgi:hypothetical protein
MSYFNPRECDGIFCSFFFFAATSYMIYQTNYKKL